MNKQPKVDEVVGIALGERERFSDESGHALPEGVVPAFDIGSLSCFLANSFMNFWREDFLIGIPEI